MAWRDADAVVRWLERAKHGDEEAWEKIVKGYADLVYATARKAGLHQNDAEDVFQATFVALYRSLDRIEDGRRLGKWLVVTASRESVRVSRLLGRSQSSGDDSQLLDELIAADEAAVDSLVADGSQAEQVYAALNELKPLCRELLTALFAPEPAQYEQISADFGIAVGSIGPTRARCIESLRKLLAKYGFFEDPVSKRRLARSSGRNNGIS